MSHHVNGNDFEIRVRLEMSNKTKNGHMEELEALKHQVDTLRSEINTRHRTEHLLREALDTFTDHVILYDKDERVVFTNDRYHETYPNSPPKDEIAGYTYEQLLRFSLNHGQIDHPLAKSDPDAFVAMRVAERAGLKGKKGSTGETTHSSGQSFMYRYSPTSDGGVMLIQSDITELKQAETGLRKALQDVDEANQDLEKKVKARTRALKEAIKEAETMNLTKSEFLANMSHELRTPLNAIIGFSDMIKGAMFGPLESKYQEYAKDINASGEHLLGVIADILDLSKVEAGELDIKKEEVDVRETAAACATMMSGRAIEAGVTLTFSLDPGLPPLYADPLRLKQILLNLIGNAIKFTPRGGRIIVSGQSINDGGVVLVVKDTGTGIAKQDISKALEKFGQIRDGHTHAHEGAGLGLALAKSLMERHGGTLSIESEIGIGTTVTVTFPPERTIKPMDRGSANG